MKFFSQVFERVAGIEIFSVLSLAIFFILFLVVIIRAIRLRKEYVEEMSNLPLHGEESADQIIQQDQHVQ
jgi:cytochrome c oxidase cbb3-type subunit IV